MARKVVFALVTLLLWTLGAVHAEEVTVQPGLITANNVDITTDDGSLLPERLNVGDQIFVIVNPKNAKKGWVRITRSDSDPVGIGWVESKNIRTFSRYQTVKEGTAPTAAEKTGEKWIHAPDVEPSSYSRVGVVPFIATEGDEKPASRASEAFSAALRTQTSFEVVTLPSSKLDVDSPEALRQFVAEKKVDGVFVGKLSGDMGGSRLLQVKFFGKSQDGFVFEKTTRLPTQADMKEAMTKLASSTTQVLK